MTVVPIDSRSVVATESYLVYCRTDQLFFSKGVPCTKMTTTKNVFGSSSLVDISKLECVVGNPFGKYAKVMESMKFVC